MSKVLIFFLFLSQFTIAYSASEDSLVGEYKYIFNDGQSSTSFLTSGRQFEYEIMFSTNKKIPLDTFYHYFTSCWGEQGKNRFEDERYDHPILKSTNLIFDSIIPREIYTYSVKNSMYVPENKQLLFCSFSGSEYYNVDKNCSETIFLSNLTDKNLSSCKRSFPLITDISTIQVYSSSEYDVRLQLLQQEKLQSENFLLGASTAFLAAFLGAGLPLLYRWYNRPIFDITFIKNEDPYLQQGIQIYHEEYADFLHTPSMWLSIGVRNRGKSTAKNCYAKLIEIKDLRTGKKIEPFYPSQLFWTIYKTRRINISKSEEHLLNIVQQIDKDMHVKPACVYPNTLEVDLLEKLGTGEYLFLMKVFADNAEPKAFSCAIRVNEDYTKLRFII